MDSGSCKKNKETGMPESLHKIDKDTLFMKYPSSWWHDLWREGLASGNGKAGANTYGGVKKETVMLAHHDLWHGGCQNELPDVSGAFVELRKKMDEGQFREASWTLVNALKEKGYESSLESFLPLADLNIEYKAGDGFEQYLRGVQMDTGETWSHWRDGEGLFLTELFVSRADDMVIKRIRAKGGCIDLRLGLGMHINEGSQAQKEVIQHITDSACSCAEAPFLTYMALNDDGLAYGAAAIVKVSSGEVAAEDDTLHISGCEEATIFLKLFLKAEDGKAETEKLKKELGEVGCGYEYYLDRHRKLHEPLYRSAGLSLDYQGHHSNEELLLNAYGGEQSPELVEKLWKFGRYLFISGTDKDANPFPLYGLWGGDYQLVWCHNMANVNMQMIYWHSMVGNLWDFNQAIFRYFNNRIEAFRDNAKKLFGMKGLYFTAGTTPGVSAPTQVVPVIINWVHAGGWIAQHYYTYYMYSRDKAYLRETILPFLMEIAEFYEDFITFYPDGSIKLYPSVSPENTPGNFMPPRNIQMAHPMPTTINSTIDLAIVKEFFTDLTYLVQEEMAERKNTSSSEALSIKGGLEYDYEEKLPGWQKILSSIPEYKINEDGGIREWQDERFQERYDHRHFSHIYPAFPGTEVNSLHNKELLPAFKRACDLREIDAQTGWSQAYMACMYARFEDGEKAMKCLSNMAKSSVTSNLFTLHNDWRKMNISLCMDPAPVQMDANMGYVNAVQEMLVYSSKDFIKLLPGVPACMGRGEIKDFCYMSGKIYMKWDLSEGTFTGTLQAQRSHEILIKLPNFIGTFEYKLSCDGSAARWQGDLLHVDFTEQGVLLIEGKRGADIRKKFI